MVMGAKQTFVALRASNVTREFEFTHAERLLRMPNSGWRLPDESQYEFVNNAIRRKQIKKVVGERGKG